VHDHSVGVVKRQAQGVEAIAHLGIRPVVVEGGAAVAIETDETPITGGLIDEGSLVREGGAVVLFPEGGRGNPDGSMRKFKVGAVRMALEAGVPILPVTIRGGHRVWPNTLTFPRLGHRVEIIYHPLFVIEQRENEDVRECARRETERLAEIIRSAL